MAQQDYAYMEDDKNVNFEYGLIDIEYKKRKRCHICWIVLFLVLISIGAILTCGYYLVFDDNTSNTPQPVLNEMCPNNNTQYPMKGGPGCRDECDSGEFSASLNYIGTPWSRLFAHQINESSYQLLKAVEEFNLSPDSVVWIDERDQYVHMTMDYFCCLNRTQLSLVDEIVGNYEWPPINVTFEKVICVQDGYKSGKPYKYNEIVELIVYCDNKTQNILLNYTTQLEHILFFEYGIPIKVPRRENIGFHVTIGFVNGSAGFPVNSFVDGLNNRIEWDNKSLIIGNQTICNGIESIDGVNYTCLTS